VNDAPTATSSLRFDLRTRVFLVLSAINVTALLVANMIGVKLFSFELDLGFLAPFKVEHTAGMLAFPITFVLTDLINEFYGRQAARLTAWIAFAMALVAFVIVSVGRSMPILEGIPGTADARSFEVVFGGSTLMTLASIVAFLLGSMLDIAIFGFFKRLTRGRLVWLRATGSTLVSQLMDSFVVTILFFQVAQGLTGGEVASPGFVIRTALTGYILKFVLAIALTPLIYLGRMLLRRVVGLEPLVTADPEPASAA
jgi:hypothetical protein